MLLGGLITQVYSRTGRMMAAAALRLLSHSACTAPADVQTSISQVVMNGSAGSNVCSWQVLGLPAAVALTVVS